MSSGARCGLGRLTGIVTERQDGGEPAARGASGRPRTVQSLERSLTLLERMADLGGLCSLSDLAAESGLPLATAHRLMGTLVAQGYARRASGRRYVLGPRLIRLGDAAGRAMGSWASAHLADLAQRAGESANLAMLDGDRVVYLAQAPGRHAMRMFTEPGRRVDAHCTAVGKAMLARLPERRVRQILERSRMPRYTAATITDPDAMVDHLATVRRQGYAIDDGEQEVGVRCVAAALAVGRVCAAVSVSGPTTRMTPGSVRDVAAHVIRTAERLSQELDQAPL